MKHQVLIAVCAAALTSSPASAAQFVFELEGELQSGDQFGKEGEEALPPRSKSFTFRAVFDEDGTTYQAGPPGMPLPGYVAYAFDSATITLGEITYDVASFADDPIGGVTVALFDPSNVFNPGFYGVGFFGNPLGVGPGMIARFANGPAGHSAGDPAEGEFSGFIGHGALSGPTIDGGPGFICFADPSLCEVTPINLTRDGMDFNLILASGAYDSNGGSPFSARLTRIGVPVPEPSTWARMLLGMFGIGALMRRRGGSADGAEAEVRNPTASIGTWSVGGLPRA